MDALRLIAFGSEEYEQACVLRNEVLREPLGLSLWDEDLSGEGAHFHFGLFSDEGCLEACCVVNELSDRQAKLRQVAVRAEKQERGLGRRLLHEVEEFLREKGFIEITLHSRVTVVGFYHRLDYEDEGAEFLEVGVAHQKMRKVL